MKKGGPINLIGGLPRGGDRVLRLVITCLALILRLISEDRRVVATLSAVDWGRSWKCCHRAGAREQFPSAVSGQFHQFGLLVANLLLVQNLRAGVCLNLPCILKPCILKMHSAKIGLFLPGYFCVLFEIKVGRHC